MFLLTLLACGPSPSEVASSWWADSLAGRDEAAYHKLCKIDRDATPLAELEALHPVMVAARKKATFAVRDETVEGDTVRVNVAITRPDFDKEQSRLIDSSLSAEELRGVDARLLDAIDKGTLPLSTTVEVVTLHRSEDGWCVFRDLATRKKIVALAKEFTALVKKGDLDGAKAKADAAIALMPEDVLAKDMVAYTTQLIAERNRTNTYKPKIEVRNVKLDRLCDRCPSRVRAEVKNGGDQTLTEIELKVSGLDANGTPVWDKDIYPVFVSSLPDIPGIPWDNAPLRPNYSRVFEVYPPNPPPSDWTGKVSFEVKELRFE